MDCPAMYNKTFPVILLSAMVFSLGSCGSIMNKEKERVPVPPSGTSERSKPWNETQRFEGEAALGPLANPRR